MKTYLEQYYDTFLQGKVQIGYELQTLLESLIKDLNSDKYIYDIYDAYLRIELIERFCKHTKDPFTGMPFRLMLWEKAFVEVMYSFKNKKTGRDRFKKILLLIARKNGKTSLLAALMFAELLLGSGKDLVCASNNDEQAKLIFTEVENMIRLFDPYYKAGKMRGKYFHINISYIKQKQVNNVLKRLTDRQKSGLGRNLNFVAVDESNQLVSGEMPSQLFKGTSIKLNAKFINITTDGVVHGGYLDKELIKCREILAGEKTDDISEATLPWLYTQDSENEIWTVNHENVGDIEHPCVWQKSNPSLYEVKQPQYIFEQLDESQQDNEVLSETLVYDFNIKQNAIQSWLAPSEYEYIQEEKQLADFKGSVCLAAVDLSQNVDLTNVKILLMKPNDNKKYIFGKYFLPESKLQDSNDKKAGAKYLEWHSKGYCDLHEGNGVKVIKVAEWFRDLALKYGIKVYKLGYDRRLSEAFIETMASYGYRHYGKDATCESLNQDKYTLSSPMKMVKKELQDQLIHGLNEMDKWCLANTSYETDSNFMIKPAKTEESKRIDGAAVLIMLYAIFIKHGERYMKYINSKEV